MDRFLKERLKGYVHRGKKRNWPFPERNPKGGGFRGNTKPLKHLKERISEIVVDERDGTFRAVYTVEFGDAVAVLHVFQKKSKSGISTPKQDVDLILQRLKQARVEYHEWKRAR